MTDQINKPAPGFGLGQQDYRSAQNPFLHPPERVYPPLQYHCKCEIHKVVHVLDLLAKFVCKLETHMADLTALKQAVADNAAATDAVVIKIDELKAAIANIPADNQPEVDAVVADLTATVERLKAAVA